MTAPVGGIFSGGQFGRPRGGIVGVEADADAGRGLEEVGVLRGCGVGGLPQRSNVVEDPEASAVGARDEIGTHAGVVILDLDIADGDGGHVEAEGVPVVAIVDGDPDLAVGGGIEQALLARVFADGVGDRAGRDAVVDFGPGLAAIVGAPEVRIHVVEAQGVSGGVGGFGGEVACVHVEDAGPGFHFGGRDVGPLQAAVRGDLNHAIARAGPEHVGVERGGREGCDGALRGGRYLRGVLAGVRRDVPFLTGEIAADGGPGVAAVDGFPDARAGIEEDVRIFGRPDQGLGADGSGGGLFACGDGRADVRFLGR